ncbi:hypothetical protein CDIK_0416 [Cucumispora dikerogammari]|nr:hypothetical protein CDIK_0416 [Cucumispora dikerogammari]
MLSVFSFFLKTFQIFIIKVLSVNSAHIYGTRFSKESPEMNRGVSRNEELHNRNEKDEVDENIGCTPMLHQSGIDRFSSNFELRFATGEGKTSVELKYGILGAILLCIVLLFFATVASFRTVIPLLWDSNYR